MRGWYWWLLGLLALGAGAPMLSPRPVAAPACSGYARKCNRIRANSPMVCRTRSGSFRSPCGYNNRTVQPRSADIGINTFIGLWHPPTEQGLAEDESHGLYLIVQQTPEAIALRHKRVIRGWLHVDEPDNAQPIGGGGHGDCIMPEDVVQTYNETRAIDPTRPVYLNFGQAVANPRRCIRGSQVQHDRSQEDY